MLRSNPWQSYRKVATQTAPPGQLVLMLYEGAIRFLEQARTGFAAEDPLEFNQTIHNNTVRAQEIIRELDNALEYKQGGQLAATLHRLYDYMDTRLHDAIQYKKEERITEVLRRLSILRDAWAEMLQKNGNNQTSPEMLNLSALG
jgi:flagellar secretion chaperone FliS